MPPTWSSSCLSLSRCWRVMTSIASRALNMSAQGFVNRLVPQVVKNLLTSVLEFFDALAHALVGATATRSPARPALGLRRMGRQPVRA